MILFDVLNGLVEVTVDEAILSERSLITPDLSANRHGFGRELFVSMRQSVGSAEEGASLFDLPGEERA